MNTTNVPKKSEFLSFAIIVHGDPDASQAAASALKFAEAVISEGHQIERVFFYHDSVALADTLSITPQDESRQLDSWLALARQHQIELAVCIAAAIRRGVLNDAEADRYDRAAANCDPNFEILGLGQMVDAVINADRTVTFPG